MSVENDSNMSPDMNQQFQNYYPAPPIQEVRVGFGKRFGVYLLDGLIVLLLAGILSMVLPVKETFLWKNYQAEMDKQTAQMEEQMGENQEAMDMAMGFTETMGVFTILISLVSILYSLVEFFTGASPAKHMFGIVAAQPNGAPGNTALWGTRWFIKHSSTVLSVLGIILGVSILGTIGSLVALVFIVGCFFALGEEKQALHDKIAKTAVFHKEDVANMQVQPIAAATV